MGSEYVVADIISIVEYMKKNYNVDEKRIYLIGCSGGGYASFLWLVALLKFRLEFRIGFLSVISLNGGSRSIPKETTPVVMTAS
ncbi:MAG: S9 family peptidase [Lentisphaerales bacterium]|nr:S9 family peptidase [Lentisphaerales bacterium]